MQDELLSSLDQLIAVLRSVTNGDLHSRMEVTYPETHPVGALMLSANAMIEALADARRRTEEHSLNLAEKIATIERQAAAIQDLSTPIMEVWPGVLCMPIIGALDSDRSNLMTRTLLATIVEKKAGLTIIDVTGIDAMDTRATDNFVRMARSVRLLGAKCVVSGVHPNIARTIVRIGVDLAGIKSFRTLRDALRSYVRSARPAQSH
jgi:rsbT co-antagonist protein RsbR